MARAIRDLRVCGARRDAISKRARVRRKVKVEYLSLLLGLLVFTSRRCDNEVSWSRSHWFSDAPRERDGSRCARASEPPPAPAWPALISLPAAGKLFACATPFRLGLRAATALRRTRIFLDKSASNLFTR